MPWRVRVGSVVFSVAIALFGVQHFLFAAGISGPHPGPPWTAGSPAWALLTGAILICCAAGMLTKKWVVPSALELAAMVLVRVLVDAVALAGDIRKPQKWTGTFELLALCAASLVLASILPRIGGTNPRRNDALDRAGAAGRFLFAAALVVFGVQHLMYADFVATLVPAWIPGQLFWSWFFGFAFIATALSLVANRVVRLAGTLLAVMFLSWVITLHIPRTRADLPNGNEWTSAILALALCGSGFILAESRSSKPSPSRP